jgi:hypothetical protein
MARYPQEIAEAQARWKKHRIIILQRNRMLDIWEPKDRVMKLYWYTSTELKAMDKLKILNLAIRLNKAIDDPITKEWLRIDDINEEQEVYIEYFQTLPVWEIKNKAIEMRYNIIKELDLLKAQQMQEWWMIEWQNMQESWATNSARNVATAQASSAQAQSQSWVSSLSDIT